MKQTKPLLQVRVCSAVSMEFGAASCGRDVYILIEAQETLKLSKIQLANILEMDMKV